ncbi:ABC transporter substrate-binding protein [Streptomyces blattellae]|uniref:ABC transporter substrate-binding protein n=1 Tax=Streptomyces blattellae TaxID=2569855 RepID=UPI0012B81629|nr:ABC transporter substrate-binding protein [Streptomyces blattellae]
MNSPRHAPSSRLPSRRGLLVSAGALALGGVLTACGDGGEEDAEGTGGGSWSFEDDRGRTVTADSTSKRLVAFIGAAAALHDLGVECAGVFGPTKLSNGEPAPQAGDLDVDKVTSLGNTYPQFNVERYAALRPDLLIAQMAEPPALWYVPEESAEEIESLAPSVGITTTKSSLTHVIARFTELAASLGADTGAAKVTAAKERFETAAQRLRRAAGARRGGLKVMAVSASSEILYVANPDDFADLRYYASLGVEFVTPTKTAEGGFWQQLAWENADTYDADLILVDNRDGNLQPDELRKTEATWASLPAVRADQVFPWANEERFSHAGYAPRIEQLASAVGESRAVSG